MQAGDYLVHTCPTWSWEAGDPKKARSFLPRAKQYLITRNGGCLCGPGRVLPSMRRVQGCSSQVLACY